MRNFLKAGLALAFSAIVANAANAQTVYLVSNAHLDSQWNWDVKTTINEYVPATLYRNLALMEQYPDYVFNCESGIKYAWMKEYHPEAYSKLKTYIQEGRWHISGSCWEASDANIPSTESLTRNILYGQHFYESEFGVLSTDIFLPDCFGFGQELPTIAAHCGLLGFSTQKLQWRNNPFYGEAKEPFPFGKWRGVDGSEIYMALQVGKYSRKFQGEDLSESQELVAHAAKSPLNIGMFYYGTGDIGGSPTIPSVQSVVRGVGGKGPVKIISAASDQLFKDLRGKEVETWDDELLMDVHGTGCYTSQAAMKLFNRRNEQLADIAERSSVMAELLTGKAYPKEKMEEIWKRFIWHQFHDDLTGTSIPKAYEYSWNDEIISLLQSKAVAESSIGALAAGLDTRCAGEPLVLFNPSAFARKDVVTIEGNWKVYDEKGKAAACQICDGKTVFVASVPALGTCVYSVKPAKAAKSKTLKGTCISNSVYTIYINKDGDIESIKDRRNGRELVAEGKVIRLALTRNNKSYQWPAWEITKEVIDSESEGITGNVKVSVVENGPVRKSVRIEKTDGESTFVQYVRLYEGADADRIDFVNQVDWNSTATLLKAEFPLSVSNPYARYDIGTGSLLRNNNTLTKYEVYAQQWADLSSEDGSYGVSILNDCKYGWDKPADNMLRLTLLHTPETKGRYTYQDHQDFGHHEFTYSIIAHAGDWNACGTVDKAEELNQPVRAFFAPKHPGSAKSLSFLKASEGVSVKALKKAEDGDGYIVRVYEVSGKAHKAELEFALPIASIEELNGNEKPLGSTEMAAQVKRTPVTFAGKKLSMELGKSALKTIRVRFTSAAAGSGVIAQAPVALEFNQRAATFNAFRADGSFDNLGNSYPGELIPAAIDWKGINFKMGDPWKENAIRCLGDEVALPEGNWNKLYVLAAANREDVRAAFEVGGKSQEVTVPCYTGFIGQWGHTGHTEGFIKNVEPAFVGTHMHSTRDNCDMAYDFANMFCLELEVPQGAKSVILPENRQIGIFAMVVANDGVNVLKPANDELRVAIPFAAEPELNSENVIFLSEKNVCGFSGFVKSERPELAFDENVRTKWCDNNADNKVKFLEIDLKKEREFSSWYIAHAGHESKAYITRDFSLQVRSSETEPWKTVDSVSGNRENYTDRKLDAPVKARFVRLEITAADQTGSNIARIYEFSLR